MPRLPINSYQDRQVTLDDLDERYGSDHLFGSAAEAQAYRPVVAPEYISTAFYDGGKVTGSGARYRQVVSEPTHNGKLSITLLNATVIWYEIAEPEVHIAMLGARMDGVTDDAQALRDAQSIGRPVRLGPGRIRLASMVEVTDQLPIWRGTGSDVTYIVPHATPNTTTLIGDHDDQAVIKINTTTLAASESLQIAGLEISGKPSSPPNDQHGVILASRSHWAGLSDLVFSNLTGLGIAIDPSRNPYCQNMAIRDTSFFKVGGCLGLTADPANGADFLACTLLQIHNVNLDHSINPQSPRPYMWDFRAIREISADTFLNEGAGAVGCDVVMAFSSDAYNSFNNIHIEFTSNKPTYVAYWYYDADAKFYNVSVSGNYFRCVNAARKFGMDARVNADVHVIDWTYYDAASVDDICSIGGYGGSMVFERFRCKTPFSVPVWMRGQIEIRSIRSLDHRLPFMEAGPTLLARWRPSDGDPTAFNAPNLWFTTANIASAAIETDPDNARLAVYRMTGTAGNRPIIRCQVVTPDDWFDATPIGPVLTLAIRYRYDLDFADAALDPRILPPSSATVVSSPDLASHIVNRSALGKSGEWQTCVIAVRPIQATINTDTQLLNGSPTQPVVLRLAAVDLFLGRHWQEPLDMAYP